MIKDKAIDLEAAVHLLQCSVNGLKVNGEHDNVQNDLVGCVLNTYRYLRPLFPEMKTALAEAAEVTVEEIEVLKFLN